MEISGIMSDAFKIWLGNGTVLAVLCTWAIAITLLFTVIQAFKDTEL